MAAHGTASNLTDSKCSVDHRDDIHTPYSLLSLAQAYVMHSISRLSLFRLAVTNFSVMPQKKFLPARSGHRVESVRGAGWEKNCEEHI